jgi:biotin carboxylase
MRILVLHRVPDSFVHYAEVIDHDHHDVTYISVPARFATLPAGVRARRIERPGTGDTAAEVLDATAGEPAPDLVIALSEYDLVPAARVREALGVPGPRERDVLPVRDKIVMKSAVAAAGLPVPRFMPLSRAWRDGVQSVPWTGHTILKPVAGASSEGVAEFPTVAAALDAARGVDGPEQYELEEFVDGPIVHVDGLMAAGELVAVQASRYVGTCLGYARGRPLGSVQTDTGPVIVGWTLRCLRAVGILDGPFHLEGMETATGPVFLEVGARFGGADVVDTFALATGVHLPSVQVRQLVEGSAGLPVARIPAPEERYGWFVFPGHHLDARYCEIHGQKTFQDDPLVRRWVERRTDEPISGVITYADSDVPLAGVVGPASTAVLERFFVELFDAVTVQPRTIDDPDHDVQE